MSLDPITAIFDLGKTAIDKLFPNASDRAEALYKLEKLRQDGNLAELNAHVQLMLAQIKVNEVSASSSRIWVAGARPYILWIGGTGLAWQFICYPILLWLWAFLQAKHIVPDTLLPPPVINSEALFALVSALLGVGGMRSFDKAKNVSTEKL